MVTNFPLSPLELILFFDSSWCSEGWSHRPRYCWRLGKGEDRAIIFQPPLACHLLNSRCPRSCQQQAHSLKDTLSIQQRIWPLDICISLYTLEFLQASVPQLCQFLLLDKSRSQAFTESPAEDKSGQKRKEKRNRDCQVEAYGLTMWLPGLEYPYR